MNYLNALEMIHGELSPNNYVEIGCGHGKSLSLSRCQSLVIDPDFDITETVTAPVMFFSMTSDEFFRTHNIKQLLDNPVHFAFIDGMHKSEFVLRDFMNIEKNGHSGTVIAIDDVLPEQIAWASRERETKSWTGDVYKIVAILRKYRPDLLVQVLDVRMKGLALITNINPASTILSENYSLIEMAILAGEYKIDSVRSIRDVARPIPANKLHGLLHDIKNKHATINVR